MKANNLFIVLIPILLATALANGITPSLYRNVPSDFVRTKLILETLRSGSSPSAVLFGNSILMSGVDSKQLAHELHEDLIFNLGSNGQTLAESMLYYSKTPTSVKTVFQFLRIEDLEPALPPVEEAVLRNFIMYGYTYDSTAEKLIRHQDLSYFEKNRLHINFDARTIIPNTINRSVRKVLRKDLDLEASGNDLFFPNVYSQRIDQETYRSEIIKHNPPKPLLDYRLNRQTVDLLEKAQAYFKERKIDFIIVLYPINPDLDNFTSEYKKEAEKQLSRTSLNIINCINVLPEEEFVDYWHISRPGAKIFTDSISKRIHAF